MQAVDGARSFVRINKVTSGWTWSIQVTEETTIEELRDLKEKALELNEELANGFFPQPEEPEF